MGIFSEFPCCILKARLRVHVKMEKPIKLIIGSIPCCILKIWSNWFDLIRSVYHFEIDLDLF